MNRAVLIVDDTPSVRAALGRILGRAGYEVLAASGGDEALTIARSRALVAAVVDYQMPGMNGLELLSRLRTLQPSLARILLSGALDLDVVMRAVNRGDISRVLSKPATSRSITNAVAEAIAHRTVVAMHWAEKADDAREARRQALSQLFRDNGIALALQPIVRSADRAVVAYEGLLRTDAITRRSGGPLGTVGDVIDACEENGALADLGTVVARRAADWLLKLPTRAHLFLNLHPSELADPEGLLESLGPLRAFSERVVLEITERASLGDKRQWEHSVETLRAVGFRIALDDLGAGAASLATLADVDPEVLKLDLSLVRGVDRSDGKRAVVRMLCRFARERRMEVVTEGVETEAEARALLPLGPDMMQGYHFGRPTADAASIAFAAVAAEMEEKDDAEEPRRVRRSGQRVRRVSGHRIEWTGTDGS
ncbi:MAG: EAL domain-containing protein [Sandaracinaceae bacterium]